MAVALEQFVKQIADSGVISPGKLENFVPPKAQPKDAEELVRQLVQSKYLTTYQAQEVLSGRAKSLIMGNYTLLDKIGAGGMGQVFKARHRRMERVVAIKMLPAAITTDTAAVARFQREVLAAAKLEHPNIVAAYDADDANGRHFLVMQFVDGKDLSAFIKRDGPLPIDKALDYILQAARGLEYAHKHGVVHRDIKPSNLLLDSEGTVRISDMGLARINAADEAETQSELTGTGAIMGTVDYMAPEQAISTHHANARSDIYSLGCTLHYLTTGHPAYGGISTMAKLVAHRENPIPALGPDVPAQVQAVFEKMVAKKSSDRYQTMSEVITAIENCQDALTPRATTSTAVDRDSSTKQKSQPAVTGANDKNSPPGKRRTLVAAGAAGFLLLLLGVIVIIRNQKGEEIGRLELPAGQTAEIRETGPITGKADLNPKPITNVNDPAFQQWIKSVAALPAEQQVKAVVKKLRELNPDFDGAEIHKVEDGIVTEFELYADHLTDISPLRAFARLKSLICYGNHYRSGILADISPLRGMPLSNLNVSSTNVHDLTPLKGMPLTIFYCGATYVADLSPLKGMRLATLHCDITNVSDLSPLEGMPLKTLYCDHTLVHDLTPLHGMELTDIHFTPEKISGGIDIIRQMKSIEAISCRFDADVFAPGEFWKRYDAGEFGKPVAQGKPITNVNDPVFQQWMKEVAALPAEEQVKAVAKKLQELNPGFDGKITGFEWHSTPKIENGVVTEFGFDSDDVIDISPVRALAGLGYLRCAGSEPHPGSKFSDLSPLRGMSLKGVCLAYTQVADLSPLKGMQIEHLDCNSDPLKDLSQLEGMPLTDLSLGWCWGISDLSPLKEMHLKILHCNKTQVSDLAPLRGMPLSELDCSELEVVDLAPLRGMPLKWLDCSRSLICDLSPLKEMPLNTLWCHNTAVSSLSPLRGMPLRDLLFSGTQVVDLSPLAGMPLARVVCDRTPVSDLSPLQGLHLTSFAFTPTNAFKELDVIRQMKGLGQIGTSWNALLPADEFWKKFDAGEFKLGMNRPGFNKWLSDTVSLTPEQQVEAVTAKLRELNPGFDGVETHRIENGVVTEYGISAAHVADISPVRAFTGLTSFSCAIASNNGILADLSPLDGMRLNILNCSGTGVSDLTPLKGMPLTVLYCRFMDVADLSPLKGMRLTALFCDGTKVSDLSALEGMPLLALYCDHTLVSDLTPLHGMNITELSFTPKNIEKGIDVIRGMKSIERINNRSNSGFLAPGEFWKKYDAGEFK